MTNSSIANTLRAAAATFADIASSCLLHKEIESVVELIVSALESGNKLILVGNGGSAADCQHMAAEFVCRFMFDRNTLPAIALTTDTSVITAIANDYGYEHIFSRQLLGIAQNGDVLLAYSTSGSSPNVINALRIAPQLGVSTVGLTGENNGEMNLLCDRLLQAPSGSVPRIQEIHLLMGHTICEMVEYRMFKR